MKRFYALVALLCLQLHPAYAQEDAKQFLREVYLSYVEGDGEGVPLEGPALRNTFTEELSDIIDADAKKGDLKRMTYDPLADAEEWEIDDVRISIRPISPTHAMGNVAFLNFEEAAMVNVDLVKTQNGWRIDDIQVPDGRLRDLFKGPDPEPEPAVSGDAGPAATPASVEKPAETAATPVEVTKPAEGAKPVEITTVDTAKSAEDLKPAETKPAENATLVEPVKPKAAKAKSKPKRVAKPKPEAAPPAAPVETKPAETTTVQTVKPRNKVLGQQFKVTN